MPKAFKASPDSDFHLALLNCAELDAGAVSAFWAVSMAGLSVALSALGWGLQMSVMAERVVASVDLAALTAADTHRGLISGSVCENAELILQRVDLALTTCRIVSDGVMVSGQLSLPLITHRASATAGEK